MSRTFSRRPLRFMKETKQLIGMIEPTGEEWYIKIQEATMRRERRRAKQREQVTMKGREV